MEKFIVTSVKNFENKDGKALVEKNAPAETKKKEEEEEEEVKIISHKVVENVNSPSPVADRKSIKIKKLKVRRNRGEKRKHPDKSDPVKKVKRKKKEEKLTENNQNLNRTFNEKNSNVDTSVEKPADNSGVEKENSLVVENNSDVENVEKPVKQKGLRKRKKITNNCKETLDNLLKFDADLLNSLDNSLKFIKSHNLLNRYISFDILTDLISLAIETKGPENADSEKELSAIVTKCMTELSGTPKRSRARQSLTISNTQNTSIEQQEEVMVLSPSQNEEVLEKKIINTEGCEENAEQTDDLNISAELLEKNQEPSLEKSGKNFCITNYFKKLKRTVEERDKNERFSCFSTKTDMFLAPKLGGELTAERREEFEKEFTAQSFESSYLSEHSRRQEHNRKTMKKIKSSSIGSVDKSKESTTLEVVNEEVKDSSEEKMDVSESPKPDSTVRKRVALIKVEKPKSDPVEAMCKTKAKLFQFHDNRRPPYWGTWRKKSNSVGPRRPFGRDKMFNYEIDSDDEWEEEEEPGESLHGSDDEKEPEEDYEVDNDFFVPHGYLSDDENPEKETMSPKTKLDLLEEQFTSEQKQKTRKMTPIVFGTFWMHKGIIPEGNLYKDLQIESLQYVPWTTIPIEIEDEEKGDNAADKGEPTSSVKKSRRKIFPNEEIPNLIKMIHGSPQNCDHLARKFLLYWETEKISGGNRPGLTKICVRKKIKELAAWQASHEKGKWCWQVPKETREEFGAKVENKTPEKKPRKCFFWKFVRKAEKSHAGAEGPPPNAPAIEPEVLILES